MKQTYEVRLDARVTRELRGINAKDRDRVLAAIESLAKEPRPTNAVRLVGQPGLRIRIGNFRVLYEIDDALCRVTVFRAGHRSDVYRSRD